MRRVVRFAVGLVTGYIIGTILQHYGFLQSLQIYFNYAN